MAGRNHEIKFKVSLQELDKIRKRAEMLDYSMAQYLRAVALKSRIKKMEAEFSE